MDHKAVMICMVSTASISFAASLCMSVIIGPCRRTEQDGSISSSTYHRILFGISVSNVFQTLGLLLGYIVIPSPKDFPAKEIWTFGTISTCKASGFLHQLGQSCALMYYLFLCYLFRCKIIGKMSDHACSGDKERIVHALIIIIGISFCTTLVFLRSAKSIAVNGYYCDLGTVFPDCKNHPNLFSECDGNYEATYLISLGLRVLSLACFVGIIMLFLHICFLHPAGVGTLLFPKERKEVAFSCDQESEPKPKKGGNEELSHNVGENEDDSSIYRKRLLIQLCFYTLVSFVTYVFPIAVYVHATAWRKIPPSGFFVVGIITYSLSGFCILLVYIRPKVLSSISSQEKKSCVSIFQIFVETIKSMKLIPIITIEDQEKSQSERPHASDHDPSFQHSSPTTRPTTRRVYYTFPIPTTPKLRGLVVVPGSEDDDDINHSDGEGSNLLRKADTCPSSSGKESFTMASIPEVNEEDEDDIEEC
jgi:hypothetical protein